MDSNQLTEAVFERRWRRAFPRWDVPGESVDEQVERLMEGFEYFCTEFWHIKHPRRGRIPFEMYDEQREAVRLWLKYQNTLALKARQIGWSTLVSTFAFWLTFGYGDRQVTMISRGKREAAKLLAKSRYGYRSLPDWVKVRGPVVKLNLELMSMSNDSVIESLPSASEPARGETAFLVIVDEIGFLPNSEEAWASIEPVSDVGGRVIMLGTANGEGNLFHREWLKSKGEWTDRDGKVYKIGNGNGRFRSMFFGWWVNGRNDDWYAWKASDLPEWQMAQEYPSNPDEAFLKSGRPVFNAQALSELDPEEPLRGFLEKIGTGEYRFNDGGGNLRIWRFPDKGKPPNKPPHLYVMGVDVAEGLEHGDFSSVHVVDAQTQEVVAHWHGHIDPDLLGSEVVAQLGYFYNTALAMVESNNHGLTTLHALKRVNYFPMFRRRRETTRRHQISEQMGWQTTSVTKPVVIDELARALRERTLKLWCSETVAELRAYQRDGNGKMSGAPHDDRVMSLAIAVKGLQYVFDREYREKPKPPVGSFGWWMNRKDIWGDDVSDGGRRPIGAHNVRQRA